MHLGLAQFLPAWAFLAVNIASPGPNVLNTIATALGSGRKAAFGSAMAVGAGVMIWCVSMSFGMAALFGAIPATRLALTAMAICLLALFSFRYLRNAVAGWRGQRGLPGGATGLGFGSAFRRSLLVNVLNPKALTSWLAILGFFPIALAAPGDIAVLALGGCAVAVMLHMIYGTIFSSGPAALLYLRAGWILSGLAGCFFAVFALRLASGLVSELRAIAI